MWVAARGSLADGDAGAVGVDDRAHHNPGRHDPPGLCTGWEWNVASLRAGDGAIVLVALCIGRFARYSSSPGSLYTYASMILPPWLGATVACYGRGASKPA